MVLGSGGGVAGAVDAEALEQLGAQGGEVVVQLRSLRDARPDAASIARTVEVPGARPRDRADHDLAAFGRSLLNKSVTGMIKAHRYARHFLGEELDIQITHRIVKALSGLNLAPARIDLGRLIEKLDDPNADVDAFLAAELAEVVESQSGKGEVRDVVLYGFGRIGRLLARILIDPAGGTDSRTL